MKLKTSLFNKAILKRNITSGFGIWVGLAIIYLLMLPFNAYVSLEDCVRYMEPGTENVKSAISYVMVTVLSNSMFFVFISAIVSVIAAMYVFSYLFTGRNSNMMHTYPVSRTGLFLTNYVSGFLFITVPVILNALLALAVGAFYGALAGRILKGYMIWIVIILAENFFFYSAAVCMLMFVGNMIAVPVLYAILNFLYYGCAVIWDSIVSSVCYGLMNYSSRIIGVLTPINYMVKYIGFDLNRADEGALYEVHGMEELAGYAAAAIVFTFIAWAAYQKKNIETAGDVITVGWLKPVFRWGVAACVASLGALFFSSALYGITFAGILCSAILVGAVAFFVAQILLDRTVHVWKRKRILEFIAYTAVISICYIALDADILGLEKKMPDINEVESATVYGGYANFYMEDKEDIAWVQDIHKQIIDSKEEFESGRDSVRDTYGFSIYYRMEDGSVLRRGYSIPVTDEPGSVIGKVKEYCSHPEVIMKQYFGIHYPNVQVFGGTLTPYDGDEERRISEEDVKKLFQAAIKDVQEGNLLYMEDDAWPETEEPVGRLVFNIRDEQGINGINIYDINNNGTEGSADIIIYRKYTNLMEALSKLNYQLGTASK